MNPKLEQHAVLLKIPGVKAYQSALKLQFILQISRFRINKITAQFHAEGFESDKQACFKRSSVYKPKRECLIKFINTLQCLKSHHCRGSSQCEY